MLPAVVWVWNLASYIKGRNHIEADKEYWSEESVWTKGVTRDWRKNYDEELYNIYSQP